MGGCCSRTETTSDTPESFSSKRSCTDIIFALLFILFLCAFAALGFFSFKYGDVESSIHGSDYLGYQRGLGDGPPNFANFMPKDAPFQSSTWKNNQFLWYPIPISKNVTHLLNIYSYINLGICVERCPVADRSILATMMKDPRNVSEAKRKSVALYPYGDVARNMGNVNSPRTLYAMYDSYKVVWYCLPSLTQPDEVRQVMDESLKYGKYYNATIRSLYEVQHSTVLLLVELLLSVLLCFLFIIAMRYLVSGIVWSMVFIGFAALAAAGAFCFYLYFMAGKIGFTTVAFAEDYPWFFLCLSIFIWFIAAIYIFIFLALSGKIRLACGIIKISGCVTSSSPLLIFVPGITAVLSSAVLALGVFIAIALYTMKESETEFSLVPLTASMVYEKANIEFLNGTAFYRVISQSVKVKDLFFYLMIGDLFGCLWIVAFLSAACFTIIAFVSMFWYFSDVETSAKRVPFGSICKATLWTLIYHTGTIAFGSMLVAIIQTIRFLLLYFAKKAKLALGDNQLLACMACYLGCFLACFERVLSVFNHYAYIMMCISSNNFCVSGLTAISYLVQYASDIIFVHCMVEFIISLGKLTIICGCCVSAYFLCGIDYIAPNVELKVLPIILVGVQAYIVSCVSFYVYGTVTSSLLICYCHDRKINASRGFYYVPEELEHQIGDYSQLKKAQEFRKKQAAAHTVEEE